VADAGELLEMSTSDPVKSVELLSAAGFIGVALHGTRVRMLSRDVERDRTRVHDELASGQIFVEEIAVRPVSLEDVFVYRIESLERAAAGAR
jgi:ABC-2 type transport system ATP-binding protein